MYGSDKEALEALNNKHNALLSEIGNVIVGQEQVIREVTTAIFAGGHVLLVGVPGLAKTLLVNTIAQSLGLSFNRVQFTPDLMPSDICNNFLSSTKISFLAALKYTRFCALGHGWDEQLWIHTLIKPTHSPIQMRSSRTAGRANRPHDITCLKNVADANINLTHVKK